jgi:hypothetical protein
MKIPRILLMLLLSLALVGCGPSQASIRQSQPLPTEDSQPQKSPSQEPSPGSSKSGSSLPQLPAPTVGSVVITNITATPLSSLTPAPSVTPDPAFQTLTQQAKRDLAKRLNIDADQVDFLKVVPAKWPYDSLGCPLPEAGRADTNTPGYQILLSANDQVYMYHTDGKDWLALCSVKPPNEIRTLP